MTQPETFNLNDYAWYDHLKIALKDLETKVPELDLQWRYYDGDHPRIWMTESMRDMFDNSLAENMSENWCEPAVEAVVRRLGVDGWVAEGSSSDTEDSGLAAPQPTEGNNTIHVRAAENVFSENDMELDQKELYRQVRAVGESFLFVWKDDEREFGLDWSINDARNVWWPKNTHRNDPTRVVKVWMDDDEGYWRATIYYRLAVVRLVGPKINEQQSIPQVRYFVLDPEDPGGLHGFEKVPVVRFAIQRRRKGVLSTIKHVQDKINKLVANKLVAAEFNAFGKTAILTRQMIDDDVLRFRPNMATVLDPGGGDDGAPTSIWESTPLELLNYDQSIGTEIDKLFTLAGLPGHMQVKSTREVPSGAAYEADEGPFVEMCKDYQDAFTACWKDVLELCDIEAEPTWKNPRIRSETEESTTVKTFKDAGMPLALALKYYASGWDDERLRELEEAPLSPQETQSLAMSQAMLDINATGTGANQNGGTGDTADAKPPRTNQGQSRPKPSFGNA
jgi:SPP1 Gp6-like portal protein